MSNEYAGGFVHTTGTSLPENKTIVDVPPADFLIKFSNKNIQALLYIGSEDLPKLAGLLSDFLTSKNIENTLITKNIEDGTVTA